MNKFVGDVFDDIGCFFARHNLDRAAFCFYIIAQKIDPGRMEQE